MTVGARLLALVLCVGASVLGQSPEFSKYARDVRAADALLAQGDFVGVIAKLESWPGKLPDRAEAQHFLGLAFYRLQQFEPAIRHLSNAMELERPESAAWQQTVEILGAAYYFEGRWQDAEPLLKQAAGWRPEDSELQYTLGMTYAQLGRRDPARHAFSKVFGVDPASPQAFALAAELLLQQNRHGDAAALLSEALARKPDLPGAASKLGAIAVRQGDYGRALELLRGELGRNPQAATGWHSLGEALLGLNRQSEAVEALKRAVWLDTGAPRGLYSPRKDLHRPQPAGLGGRHTCARDPDRPSKLRGSLPAESNLLQDRPCRPREAAACDCRTLATLGRSVATVGRLSPESRREGTSENSSH